MNFSPLVKRCLISATSGLIGFPGLGAADTAEPLHCDQDLVQLEAIVDGHRLGDLSTGETQLIQEIVNQTNFPLVVVGSAAEGRRRNPGENFPIGKGERQKSDVDYFLPTRNPVDEALAAQKLMSPDSQYGNLPSLDWHGVINGGQPKTDRPRIWFCPHTGPVYLAAGVPNESIPPFPSRYAPSSIQSRADALESIRVLKLEVAVWLECQLRFGLWDACAGVRWDQKVEFADTTISHIKLKWNIP